MSHRNNIDRGWTNYAKTTANWMGYFIGEAYDHQGVIRPVYWAFQRQVFLDELATYSSNNIIDEVVKVEFADK